MYKFLSSKVLPFLNSPGSSSSRENATTEAGAVCPDDNLIDMVQVVQDGDRDGDGSKRDLEDNQLGSFVDEDLFESFIDEDKRELTPEPEIVEVKPAAKTRGRPRFNGEVNNCSLEPISSKLRPRKCITQAQEHTARTVAAMTVSESAQVLPGPSRPSRNCMPTKASQTSHPIAIRSSEKQSKEAIKLIDVYNSSDRKAARKFQIGPSCGTGTGTLSRLHKVGRHSTGKQNTKNKQSSVNNGVKIIDHPKLGKVPVFTNCKVVIQNVDSTKYGHSMQKPGTSTAALQKAEAIAYLRSSVKKRSANRRNYTKKQKDVAVQLLNNGMGCRKIGELLGCSCGNPCRWRKEVQRPSGDNGAQIIDHPKLGKVTVFTNCKVVLQHVDSTKYGHSMQNGTTTAAVRKAEAIAYLRSSCKKRSAKRWSYTKKQKDVAVQLLNNGMGCRKIGKLLGCSSGTPCRWRKGRQAKLEEKHGQITKTNNTVSSSE